MYEKFKHYVFYFCTFSFIGWIWEIIVNLVTMNRLCNPGTLMGPWLPIYGWVMIFMIILSKKVKKKWQLFILSFVLCGIIEYVTSYYLEYFYNTSWWNYDKYLLNINGRTCVEVLVVFATLCVLSITYVVPFLDKIYSKANKYTVTTVLTIVMIIYSLDFIYSSINPNKGKLIFFDNKIYNDANYGK